MKKIFTVLFASLLVTVLMLPLVLRAEEPGKTTKPSVTAPDSPGVMKKEPKMAHKNKKKMHKMKKGMKDAKETKQDTPK